MRKGKTLKNEADKIRFLTGTYDYIFFIASCLTPILSIFVYSGIIWSELSNSLSNALFVVFNIVASIFVTYKISYFGFHSQEKKHQKMLARAAIRHIRTNRASLSTLKKIVEEKKESVSPKIQKQYFTEISNHIDNIIDGIFASEIDIKETVEGLVDEEYKEESQIWIKLQRDLEELKRLQDKKEKGKEGRIQRLEQQIDVLIAEIGDTVTSLPFGYPRNLGIAGTTPADETYIAGSAPFAAVSAGRLSRMMGYSDEYIEKHEKSDSPKKKNDNKK